jgi:hypothetical protein
LASCRCTRLRLSKIINRHMVWRRPDPRRRAAVEVMCVPPSDRAAVANDRVALEARDYEWALGVLNGQLEESRERSRSVLEFGVVEVRRVAGDVPR